MAYPGVHALTRPDHRAVIMAESGRSLSYRQLDQRSNRLAQLLRDQGLAAGDHIAVFMENHIRFMEIVWAAFRSGLYITPINSYLKAAELADIIDHCDARVVIGSRARIDVLRDLDQRSAPKVERWLMVDAPSDGAPVYRDPGPNGMVWESYEQAVAAFPDTKITDERSGTTMAYSSGTTGKPKGIMRRLPGNAVDEMVPRTARYFGGTYGFGPEMVYLCPAPMYHSAPLAHCQNVHRFGGTLVVMERFDAEACLANIERYRVTHSQFVPTMFVRMLKLDQQRRRSHDLSSLRVAVHAAAPCPVTVKRQMIDWWGPVLKEYYAGSEGNGMTVISSEEWLERPGSVGRIRDGQIHICDDQGHDLPPGEVGGIYFSGAGQYRYHKAPEKTAAARLPGGRTTLGDIGYLDQDGYLYITDRKAHTIISGGVNIYPREVEDALITHPSVADVAVVGVPDEDMGERVTAVVQPMEGVAPDDDLASELIDHAREQLAHYKCPTKIEFEAQLPRLPTGKLYKTVLKERYRDSN